MNKLNESLFSAYSDSTNIDDEVKLGGAVPPVYADALNTRNKTKKELDNRFKDQEKDKDAFVKDNHNIENKPKGTKEMKKMKLSESLFDNVNEHIESDGEDGWGSEVEDILYDFFERSQNIAYEVRNCRRGSVAVDGKNINSLIGELNELSIILEDAISELSSQEQTLQEDVISLDVTDNTYYKSKRQPLADVIMRDLTSGEVVYVLNDDNKFVATHAPSLNLDEYDIGANSDSNGEYLIAWVPNENMVKAVENIAQKYNREFASGNSKYAEGDNKYFVKIYLDEADWDEPYYDPNVQIRPDGRKKKAV